MNKVKCYENIFVHFIHPFQCLGKQNIVITLSSEHKVVFSFYFFPIYIVCLFLSASSFPLFFSFCFPIPVASVLLMELGSKRRCGI